MEDSGPRPIAFLPRSNSSINRRNSAMSSGNLNGSLYRRDSNISNVSFLSDVEMAHEEVFAGPISESVPSSVTGFAHRRSRADSVASFTYFQEDDETPEWSEDQAIMDEEEEDTDFAKQPGEDVGYDLESGIISSQRRKSSGFSKSTAEEPLLHRHDSTKTDVSGLGREARSSQKIYVVSEDLTVVVAGFTTNPVGLILSKTAAKNDQNQWGEFMVQEVVKIQYGHVASTVFGLREKKPFSLDYDEDDDPIMTHLRFLDYRYISFCFHPLKDKFVLCSDWKDPNWTDVKSIRAGLDSDERHRREQVFGKNQIDIQQKSIPQLLAFHPFYIFQIASLILWSLDEYYYYAVCIFLISVVSIATTLIETRSVRRQVENGELVPGDVYEVSDPSLTQFPCDSLLLAGDCIVNESMLTGESVPVSKVPATDKSLQLLSMSSSTMNSEVAKHFLFSGTKIIRARRPQEGQDDEAIALAIVVRTGFNTTKGALVRSMLFPKPSGFKFYKDAFRVNVGGKLDVICFDKTGTLTEDGLDVLGVRVVHRPAMSDVLGDCSTLLPGAAYERDPTVDYQIHKAVLYTMATCHSLRVVDDELLGDPLDVKMFEFTGWSFEEFAQKSNVVDQADDHKSPSSIARPPPGLEYDIDEMPQSVTNAQIELGILKSFEFVSQLRRASVVVGQSGSSGGDIYVKGAPECMTDICRQDSFPVDYGDLLSFYTHRGFRVIACATKHIETLNWPKVEKMRRQDAESNLDFLGFIIFQNKLKPSTTGIIDELNNADIRKVMCTGDNILTAISVARECDLIDRTAHCFIPHFVDGDYGDPKAVLKWQSVDNSLFELDENTLMPLPPPAEADASLPYDVSNLRNYSLAVGGDIFRWIIEYGSEDVLKRMLARGQVFARMSPDEKHELVEKLQSLDYCCGFCGDGANDCGALKAADVGISLSEAEASVAAPFTSRVFDISCVPEVIR
ncbi:MAG: hypothetical protein Q9161_008364 [Pseudevernia consocians]